MRYESSPIAHNSTTARVLASLRANVEANGFREGWGDVYLDNAFSGLMLTPKQFRSYLGLLAKQGLYRPLDDGCFGEVRLEEGGQHAGTQ